jgi:hypothetical protein
MKHILQMIREKHLLRERMSFMQPQTAWIYSGTSFPSSYSPVKNNSPLPPNNQPLSLILYITSNILFF